MLLPTRVWKNITRTNQVRNMSIFFACVSEAAFELHKIASTSFIDLTSVQNYFLYICVKLCAKSKRPGKLYDSIRCDRNVLRTFEWMFKKSVRDERESGRLNMNRVRVSFGKCFMALEQIISVWGSVAKHRAGGMLFVALSAPYTYFYVREYTNLHARCPMLFGK